MLILMNTYFLTASRDMIFKSKQTFVQSQAEIIAKNLEESFDTLASKDVEMVMALLDVSGVSHVTVTDADQSVVYSSSGSETGAGGVTSAEYFAQALEGYDVFYCEFREGAFFSSAYAPVMSRGAIIGAVYVHEFDAEQGKILLDMQNTLKNISVIVVVFSVAMLVFMIWSVMRRITSILKAIKSVREGQYNYRITMSGSDELALLGDEFNSLTDRLRETEEVRRRFVADASHELKTPLASIRLLSDSILQTEGIDRETVQEFISDIGTEAERLARTTEKLMSLTRLDGGAHEVYVSVEFRRIIESTLRMLEPLAQNRGIVIKRELPEDGGGINVLATEDSLHQIVFNLVENAIKYNKPDGIVTVKLERDGCDAVLTVDDTGIGVPDGDLPYIFDRFYRVDKARSREAGGSGLGLSIVRGTVRELGGSVSAARLMGSGMRFEVRFAVYGD